MRRLACPRFTTAPLLGMTLIAGSCLLGLSGCEGEQRETGTTVEVTDQMIQDARASDAFMMEQQAKAKKAGGR